MNHSSNTSLKKNTRFFILGENHVKHLSINPWSFEPYSFVVIDSLKPNNSLLENVLLVPGYN
jgi:hypothetical protein